MNRIGAIMLGLVAVHAMEDKVAAARSGLAHTFGAFSRDDDIGTVRQPGSTTFDARSGTYRVVGNGDDLWAAKDDFHFVERRAAGDVAITATITPVGGSTEPHSKAGLMIRQDLTPGSPYVDAVVHQNGLVALQYRAAPGGETFEVQVSNAGPGRFELERRGDEVSMSVADAAGRLHRVAGSVHLKLGGRYHVGLFVCSHSDTETKTVDFSAVEVGKPVAMAARTRRAPGRDAGERA